MIIEIKNIILKNCSNLNSSNLKLDESFSNLGLDSLDKLLIINDIEEKFDIDITGKEEKQLNCINDIIFLILEKNNEQ